MRKNQREKHKKCQHTSEVTSNDSSSPNRPRNLLITDATLPFTFSFQGRFALFKSIVIHQTADDDTWPGGALWDLGVLLAEVVVGLSARCKPGKVTLSTSLENNKVRDIHRTIEIPARVWTVKLLNLLENIESSGLILELGAGVGLTGLVASSAFDANLTVITDLGIVVDKVTKANLDLNSTATVATKPRVIRGGTGRVLVTPLCWGNADDEESVGKILGTAKLSLNVSASIRRKVKVYSKPNHDEHSQTLHMPSLVLIGDVAYQHRPGAPSHFEALLSTLIKFTGPQTLVLFGTRLRMPASNDLLNLFLEHFDEVVQPPLEADEIDTSFAGLKHNMTIHFLQRK